MGQLKCVAEIMDDVRLDLGIQPPSTLAPDDPAYGPPGTQPAYDPIPTNYQIKNALNEILSIVNVKTGYRGVTVNVPVTAVAGAQGYLQIPMNMNQIVGSYPQVANQNLNTVRRVLYDNGTFGSPQVQWTLVLPTDAIYFDRNQAIQDNAQGSMPTWWFIRDFIIYITPPPAINCTFQIGGGLGVLPLISDSEYIDQIPSDYHHWIRRGASQLCALQQSGQDLEARSNLELLSPIVKDGIDEIKLWYESQMSEANTTSMRVVTYRQSYGTIRRK